MFVKVVSENGKRSACYECSDYELVDYGDEMFLLINRHAGKTINLQLDDVNGTEVYVENNQGKTVAHYNFLREKVEPK